MTTLVCCIGNSDLTLDGQYLAVRNPAGAAPSFRTATEQLLAQVDDVLDRLDHTCINDVPPFDVIEPSAENLAYTIYQWLAPAFEGSPARLSQVQVWESPESWTIYRP